jgi:hypothetical protein
MGHPSAQKCPPIVAGFLFLIYYIIMQPLLNYRSGGRQRRFSDAACDSLQEQMHNRRCEPVTLIAESSERSHLQCLGKLFWF